MLNYAIFHKEKKTDAHLSKTIVSRLLYEALITYTLRMEMSEPLSR